MKPASVRQLGADWLLHIPQPNHAYLKAVMRAKCFPELHALFMKAHDPCKEFTESYAALAKLRPWQSRPRMVWHVGDGAHCRTAAMFAFMTQHDNIAIDPAVRVEFVDQWAAEHCVRRFEFAAKRIEEFEGPTEFGMLLTFVHAHVDTTETLKRLAPYWGAAYISACCEPGRQLTKGFTVVEEGEDWSILSPERRYQVVTP